MRLERQGPAVAAFVLDNLCLKLVREACQAGAGFNIESLTNYGTFNSSTFPQEVWDAGFKSDTTNVT